LRTAFAEVLPVELLECLRTTLSPLQNDVLTSRQFQQERQNALAVNLKEQDAWLSTDIKAIKKDLKRIESSLRLSSKRINRQLLKDQSMKLKELAIISKNFQSSQGLRDTNGAVHTATNIVLSKTD
jgi:hypothetical protein